MFLKLYYINLGAPIVKYWSKTLEYISLVKFYAPSGVKSLMTDPLRPCG
jgi:hypothetical protein